LFDIFIFRSLNEIIYAIQAQPLKLRKVKGFSKEKIFGEAQLAETKKSKKQTGQGSMKS
jgi:hypothetical protein